MLLLSELCVLVGLLWARSFREQVVPDCVLVWLLWAGRKERHLVGAGLGWGNEAGLGWGNGAGLG